jgi:hypothetical protein
MSTTNRLQIIVYGQELDYTSAEALGLSFMRIADDEVDSTRKYGEFSYTFELPKTKNNGRIFLNITPTGSKNYFNRNRDLPCQVFNNNALLLDGVISLQEVTQTTYNCIFYSKLKEFSDIIADKSLQDLQFPTIQWDYEKTIIQHMNAGYMTSDDTYWQFPLIYYGTYFTPYDTYKTKQDFRGINFDIEAYTYQQFYYCMNTVQGNTDNHFYHHQMPPAFYIVSIIKQIFKDAGWTLGGQFFNQLNTKRQVMCFAGEDDCWDRAIAASAIEYDEMGGIMSTEGLSTPLMPAKLLPDMPQSDWLNGIMNMYCLYPIVNVGEKSIKLSPYSEIFGDTFNPYDITKKIKKETAVFSYSENNSPTIRFAEAANFRTMGDNTTTTGTTNAGTLMYWKTVQDTNIDDFFNYNGMGTSEIELPFSPPTVKKTLLWNDENISGTSMSAGAHTIIHPLMSEQTPRDTKKFCGNTGQTYSFNNEGYLKFNASPTIHYWYGKSNTTTVDKVGKGKASSYYYINMFTGATQNRLPIGFCSPFQIQSYRTEIDNYSSAPEDMFGLKTIATTYLRGIYNMVGSAIETDYSLVFDSQGYFHKTLWDVFHKPKYDRYKNSEVLSADMVMTEYDWQEMQLNRPIEVNSEIYHIISIENYNPITRTASLRLIKTL